MGAIRAVDEGRLAEMRPTPDEERLKVAETAPAEMARAAMALGGGSSDLLPAKRFSSSSAWARVSGARVSGGTFMALPASLPVPILPELVSVRLVLLSRRDFALGASEASPGERAEGEGAMLDAEGTDSEELVEGRCVLLDCAACAANDGG